MIKGCAPDGCASLFFTYGLLFFAGSVFFQHLLCFAKEYQINNSKDDGQ